MFISLLGRGELVELNILNIFIFLEEGLGRAPADPADPERTQRTRKLLVMVRSKALIYVFISKKKRGHDLFYVGGR